MKIDAHQHFWKYSPQRDTWIDDSMQVLKKDYLPADLCAILSKNEIDGCIAVQADQSEVETQFLLNLANENPFIKAVVGWVDLCADNIEERLAYFSKYPKFKGVRHIVQAEADDFLLQENFQHGIAKLKKFNLVYEILIRKEQLASVIAFVAKFPEQIFVLDHLAKPNIKDAEVTLWRHQIQQLAKFPNVYCKVSGMVTEADWNAWKYENFVPYLDVVFEAFGTERLLFGSDWPVCLLASNYDNVLTIMEKYISKLPEQQQQNIMGATATKIYNLK